MRGEISSFLSRVLVLRNDRVGSHSSVIPADIIEIERTFWRSAGDRASYEANLAADAVHVFPEWGIVDRDQALEGVAASAPWTNFTIEHRRLVELGPDVVALVYRACAERSAKPAYAAAVTSVYRRTHGRWQLVVHQQTPLPTAGANEPA